MTDLNKAKWKIAEPRLVGHRNLIHFFLSGSLNRLNQSRTETKFKL